MSQENVEIARKTIDAINRGDFDTWSGFLSPDVVWESVPLVGFRDVYRGRAEAREWLEQLTEVFEEAHLEIEQITPLSDDAVLNELTESGRGRGSGLPGEQRIWEIVWFAEGLITRRQPFSTRDAALEAAGLSELAMSQEDAGLARRAIDALNRRDWDAFLALMDPDIEFSSRIVEVEGGGPFRGHDGMREWWEDLFAVFPDLQAEIEEVNDLGGLTLARARQHTEGTEKDAPADQTQWHLTEWRDGKVLRWQVFVSEAEALEAAGLQE